VNVKIMGVQTALKTVFGGFRNFERGGKDNVSDPSSFITNAHNELYAFCIYGKMRLIEKNSLLSLNPPLTNNNSALQILSPIFVLGVTGGLPCQTAWRRLRLI